MTIEITVIDFYPLDGNLQKGYLNGTLRIKLPDLRLHILGVYFSKRKDTYFFQLPSGTGRDHVTGELVRFPFIVFEDKEQQKQLFAAIKEKGRAFIEARLADKENPIVFPGKKETQNQKAISLALEPLKSSDSSKAKAEPQKLEELKQKHPVAKPLLEPLKPVKKLATLEYVSLPPRKKTSKLDGNRP